MISKRHITARANATETNNPLMRSALLPTTGQSTLIKRQVVKQASCHNGTCDIKP